MVRTSEHTYHKVLTLGQLKEHEPENISCKLSVLTHVFMSNGNREMHADDVRPRFPTKTAMMPQVSSAEFKQRLLFYICSFMLLATALYYDSIAHRLIKYFSIVVLSNT